MTPVELRLVASCELWCGDFVHQDPQIEIPDGLQPERGRFSFALILAAAAFVVILAAVYLQPGRQSPPDARFCRCGGLRKLP